MECVHISTLASDRQGSAHYPVRPAQSTFTPTCTMRLSAVLPSAVAHWCNSAGEPEVAASLPVDKSSARTCGSGSAWAAAA